MASALAVVAIASAAAAQGQAGKPVAVELNKLDATGKGCRAFFVIDNPGDKAFQSLKLDFVFFNADGVIGRRLVVDVAPLRAAKKTVKTFDFDSPPCNQDLHTRAKLFALLDKKWTFANGHASVEAATEHLLHLQTKEVLNWSSCLFAAALCIAVCHSAVLHLASACLMMHMAGGPYTCCEQEVPHRCT